MRIMQGLSRQRCLAAATVIIAAPGALILGGCLLSAAEAKRGIAFGDTIDPSLHRLERTGVGTDPIMTAAEALLASLSNEQQAVCRFDIESDQWETWSNFHLHRDRVGLRLGDLDTATRAKVLELLRQTLSADGLKLAEDIIKLNHVLGLMTNRLSEFNEGEYYLVFFGTPSRTEPWGFQFEGHHLVLNTFILGDQMVMTPAFWGSEPMATPRGLTVPPRYRDLAVLVPQKALLTAFIDSFNEAQRREARLAGWQRFYSGAGDDDAKVPREGIPGRTLTPPQRQTLLALIGSFVKTLRDAHAQIAMRDVERHLDETWFGMRQRGDGRIYYRIFSPVVLVEFDELSGIFTDEAHVHAVVRTPNGNDYGRSWLSQHLEQHPH